MDNVELNISSSVENEPTVTFKTITDLTTLSVINTDTKQTMVEISGYNLQVNFNMQYINSVEDVELAVKGISDLFRRTILDKLLENKPT